MMDDGQSIHERYHLKSFWNHYYVCILLRLTFQSLGAWIRMKIGAVTA